MKEGKNIQIIEWTDLNKRKFFGYGLAMSGVLRLTIYPMNLVKTRLQAQEGKTAYNGLFDAFKKIGQREGIKGFYKGFPISLLQVFAGQLYITAYETSKQTIFNNQPIMVQHLLGGFVASTVSQSIMVPVDVVAQHQQVLGSSHKMTSVDLKNAKNGVKTVAIEAASSARKLNFVGQSVRIFRHIFKTEGIRGLYRGYLVSLSTYGSNSAFYWGFYYLYSELMEGLLPASDNWLREQFRILSSGLLGSVTAVLLTNPLDVVRTRYQLQVTNNGSPCSSWQIFRTLLRKEGYKGFGRGMSARIAQSAFSSCVVVLAYEYIKKSSLKDGARELANDGIRPRPAHQVIDHSRFGDIDEVNLVPSIAK